MSNVRKRKYRKKVQCSICKKQLNSDNTEQHIRAQHRGCKVTFTEVQDVKQTKLNFSMRSCSLVSSVGARNNNNSVLPSSISMLSDSTHSASSGLDSPSLSTPSFMSVSDSPSSHSVMSVSDSHTALVTSVSDTENPLISVSLTSTSDIVPSPDPVTPIAESSSDESTDSVANNDIGPNESNENASDGVPLTFMEGPYHPILK